MAKYISFKFEPSVGTAFDYLINVEALNYSSRAFHDERGSSYDFPLDFASGNDGSLMGEYIQSLISDAIQRPGNESFVPATDGPAVITAFAS